MTLKKSVVAIAFVIAIAAPSISFSALETGALRVDINDAITRLAAKYEARIAELEAENAQLKSKLAAIGSGTVTKTPAVSTSVSSSTGTTSATPVSTGSLTVVSSSWASTGNAEYDALIKTTNASLASILKENGLPETSQLGLYEFVSGKRAFFISIDDGKNPAGVTAFRTKILFSYDSSFETTVTGIFDLNYDVQKYVTTYGSNPYASATRIRIKNPAYTGKLLEEIAASSTTTTSSTTVKTPSSSTTSTGTTSVSSDVTVKSVRAAYDKNKLAEAIKLSTAYLAKNPNDVEILTVRYRSLYITGKYVESLKDIQAIEAVQGSKFDCTIAKDAAFIAKSAKDTAAATKYSTYSANCKK